MFLSNDSELLPDYKHHTVTCLVTRHGVSIGNWIYWTLKYIHTHFVNYYSTH
jgi:hypothetical protein